MVKFVSDLRQASGFLRVLRFPPQIKKTDGNEISEILLKVALIPIKQTYYYYYLPIKFGDASVLRVETIFL